MQSKTKKSATASTALAVVTVAPFAVSASKTFYPLAQCRMAPENVRSKPSDEASDLSGLADSLASEVGQLYPLMGYVEGDDFFATDGGRRLGSFNLLNDQDRLPDHFKAQGIWVEVRSKDEATAISLIANTQRAGMTTLEELRAYRTLSQKGLTQPHIAAICGAPERRVGQLLALTNVAPEVMEAYETGNLTLDALKAFTLSDNFEVQAQTLKTSMELYRHAPANVIRRLLTETNIRGDSPSALFVGREAYVEAGGGFVIDLFSEGKNPDWTDGGLVERLVEAKVSEIVQGVEAEGWAGVVRFEGSYSVYRDYLRDTDAGEASAEIEAQIEAIGARLDDDDDLTDEARRDLTNEAYRLQEGVRVYSDEERAEAFAGVYVNNDGTYEIVRGLTLRSAAKDSSGSGSQGSTGSASSTSAKPDFGHAGHERMTRIATVAVRGALSTNFEAAFDARLAHDVWCVYRGGNSNDLALKSVSNGTDAPDGISIKGEAEYDEAYAAWDARLPMTFTDFYPYIIALSQDEKQALFALATSAQLNALETREDCRRHHAWAQLGFIAAQCEVDVRDYWTPGEDFLKGGSKPSLYKALTDCGTNAEEHSKAKKGELVTVTARAVERNKWIPAFLADMPFPKMFKSENEARKGAGPKPVYPETEEETSPRQALAKAMG